MNTKTAVALIADYRCKLSGQAAALQWAVNKQGKP
jgi:hypothetical protein